MERFLVPVEKEAGQTSELVWLFLERHISLAAAGNFQPSSMSPIHYTDRAILAEMHLHMLTLSVALPWQGWFCWQLHLVRVNIVNDMALLWCNFSYQTFKMYQFLCRMQWTLPHHFVLYVSMWVLIFLSFFLLSGCALHAQPFFTSFNIVLKLYLFLSVRLPWFHSHEYSSFFIFSFFSHTV